jgi:hypothetical protein
VSQIGVGAAHCASVVQTGAALHLKSSRSHTGAATPQSAFERHCAHLPAATAQRGAVAGQSVFVPHSTQRWPMALQIAFGAAQSAFARQPTHAPVPVSQISSSFGQPAFVVHAA